MTIIHILTNRKFYTLQLSLLKRVRVENKLKNEYWNYYKTKVFDNVNKCCYYAILIIKNYYIRNCMYVLYGCANTMFHKYCLT